MSSTGVQRTATGGEHQRGKAANDHRKSETQATKEESNTTVPPQHRKRKLVPRLKSPSKIKYTVWLTGHCTAVVFGVISLIWKVLWLPNVYYINSIFYRLSLIGTVLALGATLLKKFGLHSLPPYSTLLAQQNFQYLVLSVVWCFTFNSVFKVLPTVLISVLQLANNRNLEVVLGHADKLAAVIAIDEVVLILYLLVRTLLFRQTLGYQLVIVLVFLWLRILFDLSTADMLAYLVDKMDSRVLGMKNEKVQKGWGKVKLFLNEKQSAKNPPQQSGKH